MKTFNYLIIICLALAGCDVGHYSLIAPKVSVSMGSAKTLVDSNGVTSTVSVSWVGTDAILIQGATNLINPIWFNIAQIISTNTNSYLVPVTYQNEFFRGVGLTSLAWSYPYTNPIDGFRVYEGTNSGTYQTNYITTNLFLIKTNLNSSRAYYVVVSYFGPYQSAFSNEACKTNSVFKLSIQ